MQINGHELKTRSQGKGPLFVWGHGLTASMGSEDALGMFEWKKFPRDMRLLRYDARGHGESESSATPDGYHWAELSRDMTALAQKHAKGSDYVLGGQSMGSATSLYAALQCPERVRGLVLVNPPTAWQTRATQGALYRKEAWWSGVLGGNLLAKAAAKNLSRLLPFWMLEARLKRVPGMLEGLSAMRRSTLFNLLRGAALTDLPSEAELASLNMPTLILAWSDDQTHPLQTAETLARLMPNAQLHVARSNEEVLLWPQLIKDFVRQVSEFSPGTDA